MRRIEAAIALDPSPAVTCHGDLTRASLCIDGDHVWIVDYRWAGAGDAYEDLGSLASYLDLSDERSDALVRLYFGSFDEERRARLDLFGSPLVTWRRCGSSPAEPSRALAMPAMSTGPLASVIEDAASDRFSRSVRAVAGR